MVGILRGPVPTNHPLKKISLNAHLQVIKYVIVFFTNFLTKDLERSEPESADQERSLLKQNGKRGQSQRRGQKSWSRSEEDGGRQTSDATESESTGNVEGYHILL